MGFFTRYQELCAEMGIKPSAAAVKIGLAKSSTTRWRNGSMPDVTTLKKIATFFGVSIDYLSGDTDIRNPPDNQSPDDIAKVALFGGSDNVSPEMWDEVKEFAKFVKAKYRKG